MRQIDSFELMSRVNSRLGCIRMMIWVNNSLYIVSSNEILSCERYQKQEQQRELEVVDDSSNGFQQSSLLQRAIELSLKQYYKVYQSDYNDDDNRINEQYSSSEYRKFSLDLRAIVENIQLLRRYELVSTGGSIQSINSEFDILRMIRSYFIQENRVNYQQQQQINLLTAINKLYTIYGSIQNKLQRLQDDLNYKRKMVDELGKSKERVEDDMEIVAARIGKLRREIRENGQEECGRRGGSWGSEEEQEEEDDDEGNILEVNQYKQQQQHPLQQYLSLMAHYQLYNPQTQQPITSQFPRNKTQAFMLLKQLDQQISQLQLKNTLQLYSH